jgi:hypothetical protein
MSSLDISYTAKWSGNDHFNVVFPASVRLVTGSKPAYGTSMCWGDVLITIYNIVCKQHFPNLKAVPWVYCRKIKQTVANSRTLQPDVTDWQWVVKKATLACYVPVHIMRRDNANLLILALPRTERMNVL